MTDKEKLDAIRAEIHRLVNVRGYDREMANDLFAFMDSLPNEPVSEGLDEAAKANSMLKRSDDTEVGYDLNRYGGFIAGAEWQKNQFEKNRLKHCNSITNEQAELEQCFIDQHLDKYNRMPTFLDAIEYGMKLKEQQLLKGTVEREVKQDAGGYPHIDATELYDYDKGIPLAKAGDKVKVVIIKED